MEPQGQPPDFLTALPSWQLSRAALRGDRFVSAALEEAGLRKHHLAVLSSVDGDGAASQAELGRRLGLDRSDLHAVVGLLAGRSLVAVGPDPADRRRNVVTLTSSGRKMLRELETRVLAAQEEVLAPLTATERAAFLRALAKLV